MGLLVDVEVTAAAEDEVAAAPVVLATAAVVAGAELAVVDGVGGGSMPPIATGTKARVPMTPCMAFWFPQIPERLMTIT